VRRALSLAIDRWKASEVLRRSSIMRYVGAYLRPGAALAAREEDLVKMPGFSKDIAAARAEAKRLLAEAGVPNLRVHLINRTISNCSHRPASTSSTSAADRRRGRACSG